LGCACATGEVGAAVERHSAFMVASH
jgi:hypothetical protein